MRRIYITHCSGTKDATLKGLITEVPPDKLYISAPIQRFMNICKEKKVDWAIFSDEYGVWFPWVKHKWYDKPPDRVTTEEFINLVEDFERKLQDYDEVWFYYNPGRFHKVYRRLIETVNSRQNLKQKIQEFSCIYEIE